jgi:tRNA U34 5-carboxymethylaminomethyl modifying GTPase MnmE/TrmE
MLRFTNFIRSANQGFRARYGENKVIETVSKYTNFASMYDNTDDDKPKNKQNINTKPKFDSTKILIALSDAEQYGIKCGGFPEFITVGNQSSGKSSVIEALCGEELLP